ncbi:MAG: hypothetical protein AB1742_00230 [bacterium]
MKAGSPPVKPLARGANAAGFTCEDAVTRQSDYSPRTIEPWRSFFSMTPATGVPMVL